MQKKDTETSKSIKAKLSIQYKMLLESLKSVFLFSHVFFFILVAIVVYGDIVTARRDIQTLLFQKQMSSISVVVCSSFSSFLVVLATQYCSCRAKKLRWYAIMRCIFILVENVWETSKSRGLDSIIWYFIKYLCVVHAFVSSNHEYQLELKRIS